MEIVFSSWWEDDKYLYFETSDGVVKLEKESIIQIYPTAIHFEGLDYSETDEITIEITKRYD